MRSRLVVCSFLLLVVLHPSSAASNPLAIAALERLDSVKNDAWSYTMTTRSKEGVTIERHDAAAPAGERWILFQKDGRAPTQKELLEYRKDKAKRGDEKPEREDRGEVDRSSIRLVSEDDRAATFQFRLRSSGRMEASFTKHIRGSLVVNKKDSWAERFELTSSQSSRPIPGVNIREFKVVMTFWREARSGEVLFETLESRIRGRAFGIKSLDDDRHVQFTDFRRPGSGSPAGAEGPVFSYPQVIRWHQFQVNGWIGEAWEAMNSVLSTVGPAFDTPFDRGKRCLTPSLHTARKPCPPESSATPPKSPSGSSWTPPPTRSSSSPTRARSSR